MSNDTKHSPTPWSVGDPASHVIYDARGDKVATAVYVTDGPHIVRCVNAHDALVEGISAGAVVADVAIDLYDAVSQAAGVLDALSHCLEAGPVRDAIHAERDQLRAALAAADAANEPTGGVA